LTLCRICSGESKFYATKFGFDVTRCEQCGFGQVDASPEVLAKFYDKEYFEGERARFAQPEHQILTPPHRWWIEDQLSHLKGREPLRVLEIGPGLGGPIAGYFERERKDDVYDAVEFSDYAAEKLRARGLNVWTGRVVDPAILEACRGRYDFVFATEVIEHDLDPHGFLDAVHKMLRPGARAAFTTGNLDGYMARKGKGNWYYLDPPAHVSYYTARAAKRAMTDVGLINFRAERFGFRHIEAVLRLPAWLRGTVLKATDVANISTGMTISSQKPQAQKQQ
jgi:SAM-dependent methyltransferase